MNQNCYFRTFIGLATLTFYLSLAGRPSISAANQSPVRIAPLSLYEQIQNNLQAKVDETFGRLIARSESKAENEWDSLFDTYQGLSLESLDNLQRLLRDRDTIRNANRS